MWATATWRAMRTTIGRRWSGMSHRRRTGLGVLAVVVLIGGWTFYQWWMDWPARLVLRGPGMTWALAFSPDGATLATSGSDGVTVWDTTDGRKRATWAIPDGRRVFTGAFVPDGRTFVDLSYVRGKPLMIDLFDVATGRVRSTIPTPHGGFFGLAVSADGRKVRAVVGDPDATAVVDCDVALGRMIASRPLSYQLPAGPITLSDDGRLLALAAYSTPTLAPPTAVILWDVDQDREVGRLADQAGAPAIREVAFAHDGSTLAIGRHDGSIELWDVGSRRLRATFRRHTLGLTPWVLRFAPDDSTLVSIGIFSRPALTIQTAQSYIARLRRDLSWEPPRELLVLDASSGHCLRRLPLSVGRPTYSPDGQTLATSHDDGFARLRDLPGTRP